MPRGFGGRFHNARIEGGGLMWCSTMPLFGRARAHRCSRSLNLICIAAAIAGAGEATPARADGVDSPSLGQTCNLPNFIPCTVSDGKQFYDFNLSSLPVGGSGIVNHVTARVLKSATLDP